MVHSSSGWIPSSGQDPLLEIYRSTILRKALEDIRNNKKKYERSLRKLETQAIASGRNNRDIIVRSADKEGSIVILNRMDYIQGGLRQLNNTDHYEILDEDPTCNEQILHVLQQGVNLNIIDK